MDLGWLKGKPSESLETKAQKRIAIALQWTGMSVTLIIN